MDYDLIAIDLDGTLLRRDGSVAPRVAASVRRARDAGLDVIIATGRALIESRDALDAIEHEGLFIGAGGAMLSRASDGATLERRAMPSDLVAKVAQSLNSHGHLAHILKDSAVSGCDYVIVGNGGLDPASRWWFETLPIRVEYLDAVADDPHPEETVRCGTVAQQADLSVVARELRDDLGEAIFLQHWPAVVESEAIGQTTHLLEVFSPNVDKWTMLSRYAASRGIPVTRIAAIGDGLNDITMIRNAGMGLAMGNADPGVIHVADDVVADNEADGVAEAIDLILDRAALHPAAKKG